MTSTLRFGLLLIVVGTALLTGAKSFAQHQSVTGFAKEFVVRNYPVEGVPLLQNFYFRFTDSDRHIQVIEVKPGSPETGRLSLGYFDDTRNDEYFYSIAHFAIPAAGVVTDRVTSTFVGGKQQLCESRVIAKPGPGFTFILSGFSLRYSGQDHHIDTLQIREGDRSETESTLVICFYDRSGDDVFIYDVDYAWVPNGLIREVGEVDGEVHDDTGGDRRALPNGIRVIRGFRLAFSSPCEGLSVTEDHHVKEIGLLSAATASGDLEVYYSDRNQDDDFCWEVEWAILGRMAPDFGEVAFDRGVPPATRPPAARLFLAIGIGAMFLAIALVGWWRRSSRVGKA